MTKSNITFLNSNIYLLLMQMLWIKTKIQPEDQDTADKHPTWQFKFQKLRDFA